MHGRGWGRPCCWGHEQTFFFSSLIFPVSCLFCQDKFRVHLGLGFFLFMRCSGPPLAGPSMILDHIVTSGFSAWSSFSSLNTCRGGGRGAYIPGMHMHPFTHACMRAGNQLTDYSRNTQPMTGTRQPIVSAFAFRGAARTPKCHARVVSCRFVSAPDIVVPGRI